ncbi:hypothetical protein EPUL_002932 [Erysiphe pulchra]|uniref:Uncharacterized protein n=1 Tax=Erysiphe pulchra TaxID=225359 RepID=A0A2S4PTC5_9PEZI|nr:hypothetical protein EPUL_002932 [Erysiphe pulchra]
MFAKQTLFLLAVALAEARFSQEQGNGAVQAIVALGDIGKSELIHADTIVEKLGNDDRVIAAARGYAAAEQNFNPFNVKIPSICAEKDLPKTEALRGVVPLIDPDVTGQDVENANSKASLLKPFDATGKSVAEVMAANGFSNFTAVKLDGTKVDLTGGKTGGADAKSGGASGASGGNGESKNAAGDKEKKEKAAGAGVGEEKKENEGKGAGAGAGEEKKENKEKTKVASEEKDTDANDKKAAGADKKKAGDDDDKKA